MSSDVARVSVTVALDPEAAFQLFTRDIDRWWRRGVKFRHSGSSCGIICIEPKVGGRLFESYAAEQWRCGRRSGQDPGMGATALWWGEQMTAFRQYSN